MGRKHRKMSDKEAEDALTQQLVETGKREQLKEKVLIIKRNTYLFVNENFTSSWWRG